MIDACDHVQQRGFATSRFANNADKFTSFDLQVNALERMIIAYGCLVIFMHIAQVNDVVVAIAATIF